MLSLILCWMLTLKQHSLMVHFVYVFMYMYLDYSCFSLITSESHQFRLCMLFLLGITHYLCIGMKLNFSLRLYNIYIYTMYTTKNIFQSDNFIFLYSPCSYMRAWHGFASWMCPVAMRMSALQGSGLVRTVGPCAPRRVPWTIDTAC